MRDVVATAAELGYYDYPRRATHDEVVAELDLAASTVAEHFRKAKSTLVDATLGPSFDGVVRGCVKQWDASSQVEKQQGVSRRAVRRRSGG